ELPLAACNALEGELTGEKIQAGGLDLQLQIAAGDPHRERQPELPLGPSPVDLLGLEGGPIRFQPQPGAALDAEAVGRLVALSLAGGEPGDDLLIAIEDAVRDLTEPLPVPVGALADVVGGHLPDLHGPAAALLVATDR